MVHSFRLPRISLADVPLHGDVDRAGHGGVADQPAFDPISTLTSAGGSTRSTRYSVAGYHRDYCVARRSGGALSERGCHHIDHPAAASPRFDAQLALAVSARRLSPHNKSQWDRLCEGPTAPDHSFGSTTFEPST
jgi:hypothetical protein